MTLEQKRQKWVNRVRDVLKDCCGRMHERTYQELAEWATNKVTWLHKFGHLTQAETNELTSKIASLYEYGVYDEEDV